jgi:hypothetical protein
MPCRCSTFPPVVGPGTTNITFSAAIRFAIGIRVQLEYFVMATILSMESTCVSIPVVVVVVVVVVLVAMYDDILFGSCYVC